MNYSRTTETDLIKKFAYTRIGLYYDIQEIEIHVKYLIYKSDRLIFIEIQIICGLKKKNNPLFYRTEIKI